MTPEQIKKEFVEATFYVEIDGKRMDVPKKFKEIIANYFLDILSKDRESLKAEIEKMLNPEYENAKYNLAIKDVLSLMERK
jgi:DNA-binding transcriptional regulator/RsmH inhibitor MraZ